MPKRHTRGILEDEDTSTEGDELVKDLKKESTSKNNDDEDDSCQSGIESVDYDEECENGNDESVPKVEPLALSRSRRSTAGNRMRELMGSAAAADEFYESAYGGGFNEDDTEEFAPVGDSDEEEDEVDSDFDRSENEETEELTVEDNDAALRRVERQKLLAKNRKWAIARFNKCVVVENVCDAKTQRQRLEEAKHTERFNVASLKRFEEFELERRKRQLKPVQKVAPLGPIVTLISRASDENGGRILVVPDVQRFTAPAKREYRVCAVTGRPARYVDPLSGLAYADAAAFRQIRDSYATYCRSTNTTKPNCEKSHGDDLKGAVEPMDTSS